MRVTPRLARSHRLRLLARPWLPAASSQEWSARGGELQMQPPVTERGVYSFGADSMLVRLPDETSPIEMVECSCDCVAKPGLTFRSGSDAACQ